MSTSKAVPAKRRRKGITPIERAAGAEPEAVAASEQAEACPSLSHDPRLWTARERVRAWCRAREFRWWLSVHVPEVAEHQVRCSWPGQGKWRTGTLAMGDMLAALVEVWLIQWATYYGIPANEPEPESDVQEKLNRFEQTSQAEASTEYLHKLARLAPEPCERCGTRRRGRGGRRYCTRCEPVMIDALVMEGWSHDQAEKWCAGEDL